MSDRLAAEVCVVGAGPVGGALACRLAAAGVSTVVVGSCCAAADGASGLRRPRHAIASGSRALLETAGLWEALPEPACPILDIRVSDGRVGRRPSPLFLHFAHREAGAEVSRRAWMRSAGWWKPAACASR